uniref:Sister chromatid cohesion protein n=1 Tax=Strongyloides stercoralis TaxID=6248 RepID=A0A0K0DSN0_STRER
MDRSAYMSQPTGSGGASGGGSFVREEMAPKKDSAWAPYGLAGLKPSLPDEDIVEKLRRSSKYFSKIMVKKEKNLSKISVSGDENSTGGQRKESAGSKAVEEIEELRKDRVKYATWMESLVSDEYIKKNNEEINIMIVSNIIKICAIASPEIPFRNKEAAAEIFEIILGVFPKIVNVESPLFNDYYEVVDIFNLYNIQSIVTDWIKTNSLKSTEKLLTSVIKCAELVIPSNPSGDLLKKVAKLGSMLVEILAQTLSDMHTNVQTLDVLFYYLVEPQKTNFKRCYELCCKALTKSDGTVIIEAVKVIRQALSQNYLFTGKRTGDKLFNVIQSLEKAVPGFINDLVEEIQQLAISGSNEKARYCLWRCAAESSSKVLKKISKPEELFQYNSGWSDVDKTRNVDIIGRIMENSNGELRFINSYISKLFKDTHVNSKLKMMDWIHRIASKNFSKISERVLESVGRVIIDSDDSVRQKAMLLLSSLHKSLYVNGAEDTYKDRVIHALSYFFNNVIHGNRSDIVSEEERIDILEKLFLCFNSNGIYTYYTLLRNRFKLFEVVRCILIEYKETSKVEEVDKKNEFLKVYLSPNALSLYNDFPKIFDAFMNLDKFQIIYDIYTSGSLSIKSVEKNLMEVLMDLGHLSIDKDNINEFRKLVERSAPLFMDTSLGKCMLKSLVNLIEEGDKANHLKMFYLTKILKYTSKVFGFNFVFLNSFDMMADIISHFEIEPTSDCGMYILRNIFASNIDFQLTIGDREKLTHTLMESFEHATPKAVKWGIFVLLHITPEDELQQVVDNLIETYSKKIKEKSVKCGRAFRILSGIAKFIKHEKSERVIELNFPEGLWEGLVKDALDVIENGLRNLCSPYKVISNSDMRRVIMEPSHRFLDSFGKKHSYAARHEGLRFPLSTSQFVAFPLYYDVSTNNIVSAINFVYNALSNRLQNDTKLIEEVAGFSSDQEGTIKYHISKILLLLKLDSNLNANLDFKNLVAVSRCLYDTDYDVRSKIVVKIIDSTYHGGVPLLSLLPLVLYSSKRNVSDSVEESFRFRVMKLFAHLIMSQQKLSYRFKDIKDYSSFILSEYAISYTIICIALTTGYDDFRDVDVIKRSKVVFEAILMTYNNLSKVVNIPLVRDILSEIKKCKLVLITEGRTGKVPFIDVDLRVCVLSEFCLSLGELVFEIFGTTTQTAPDVEFSKTIFVKSKRSKEQVLAMDAIINELSQSTKKPHKISDVISRSLVAIKKSNTTKRLKSKNTTLANSSNAVKNVPLVIDNKKDDETVISTSTKLKSSRAKSKKNFLIEASDSESSVNEAGSSKKKVANKRDSRKTTASNKKKDDKVTNNESNQNSSQENVVTGRVTRSRTKRSGNVPVVEEIVLSESDDDASGNSKTLSNSAKNKNANTNNAKKTTNERKDKKSSISNKNDDKTIEDETISIENISVVVPSGPSEEHDISLFDIAVEHLDKKEPRKRRVLGKDQENGISYKKTKTISAEPLASSTPYVRQVPRKKKNLNKN